MKYGTYRQICALLRHYFEILFTPEGMIGLYFGYWWMNMMTMKTCWICNRGLVKKDPDDPKNPPDGNCPG